VKLVPPVDANGGLAAGLVILLPGSAADPVGTGNAGAGTTDSGFAGATPMTAGGIATAAGAAGVTSTGSFSGGTDAGFSDASGTILVWVEDSVAVEAVVAGMVTTAGTDATLARGGLLLCAPALVAARPEIGSRRNCVE